MREYAHLTPEQVGLLAIMTNENYTNTIKMEYNNKKYIEEKSCNDIFLPMDSNTATEGVVIMALDDFKEGKTNLVKIPKEGAVYRHFHKGLKESVTSIIGCIDYIVYESHPNSKVIAEGILKEGKTLEIDPMQTHYVFSSKVTAYLLVNFKKV